MNLSADVNTNVDRFGSGGEDKVKVKIFKFDLNDTTVPEEQRNNAKRQAFAPITTDQLRKEEQAKEQKLLEQARKLAEIGRPVYAEVSNYVDQVEVQKNEKRKQAMNSQIFELVEEARPGDLELGGSRYRQKLIGTRGRVINSRPLPVSGPGPRPQGHFPPNHGYAGAPILAQGVLEPAGSSPEYSGPQTVHNEPQPAHSGDGPPLEPYFQQLASPHRPPRPLPDITVPVYNPAERPRPPRPPLESISSSLFNFEYNEPYQGQPPGGIPSPGLRPQGHNQHYGSGEPEQEEDRTPLYLLTAAASNGQGQRRPMMFLAEIQQHGHRDPVVDFVQSQGNIHGSDCHCQDKYHLSSGGPLPPVDKNGQSTFLRVIY